MSAPSSDSPTRSIVPQEPGHATATLPPQGAPESALYTKSFDGPDSPVSFPTPDDRYILLSFLARGGMGEVHIARDRVLNRDVALKLLRDDLKAKTFSASRFIEEARITGKLSHPGIPPIHDLGTLQDGRPFIAMKLIKGGRTLSDLLANDRPDLAELLRIFEDVCQAVASAHDRRVIHRDLKPGNVMVGAFDEVLVLDWGLAKVLGESVPAPDSHPPSEMPTQSPVSVIESDRDPSSHTKAGSLLGTPAYMPPEQAKGEIDRTDTRSDVFSLGAVLCELLTGQPPYWAASAAEIQALAIIGQLAPALERLDACGADPELIALAKQCLRLNPDERPFDAKQVANAVKAYRDGVEERLRNAEQERAAAEAKAAEEVNTRREAEKRRRTQLLLLLAASLLVVAVGGGLWWADHQRTEQARVEREKQDEVDRLEGQRKADAAREQRDREERNARNVQAIEALLQQAEAALTADDADRAAIPFGQIEKRVADGGADALAARIARTKADFAMLRELDRIADMMWTAEDYKLKVQRSTEAWAEAFRTYGIDPVATPPAEAARRIHESLISNRLMLALDLWWVYHPGIRRPMEFRKLLETADPDPFRNEVRQSVARSDIGWIAAIAADSQAFKQPPRFVAVMGQISKFPTAAREALLRPALERNPDDFSLLQTMLGVLENESSFRLETAAQQLRWAQAAVSVRPNSKVAWRNLGRAHWDRGQINDALRCYKKSVRLDPSDCNSWTQLSAVLLRTHDPDAAIEAANQALALNSEYSHAYGNLGSALDRAGRRDESLPAFDRAIELDAKNGYENATFYNNRGYARLAVGKVDGAISDFQNALRIKPDFRLAETNLQYAREIRKNGRPVEPAPPPRESVKP